MTPAPQLSISELFASMRLAFIEHRVLLVRVTVIFAALSGLASAVELAGTIGIAISVGVQLLFSVSYSGAVAVLVCLPQRVEGVGEIWSGTTPVLARLVWVRLLTAVAILAGLFIFIIPGLILMTIWAVAFQAVAVERTAILAGLARSRELVAGNGWRVFAFILLLGVVAALVALLAMLVALPLGTGAIGGAISVFLIGLAAAPIAAVGPAVLYSHLSGGGPPHDVPEDIDPFAPH